MLGMTKQFQHSLKRKEIDNMNNYFDDFLSQITCEELYSESRITEEEKQAILNELAMQEESENEND